MKPTLSQLIRPYRSISIIGMCKNAGKTTVLNQIIKEVNGSGRVLALTAIGKDLIIATARGGLFAARGLEIGEQQPNCAERTPLKQQPFGFQLI